MPSRQLAATRAKQLHADWWQARIARQKEIDASIAAKAEFEYLYDKPYEDKTQVRVAGPFTVESLSPHRVLAVDENDELIDSTPPKADAPTREPADDFAQMILENLKPPASSRRTRRTASPSPRSTPWPGNLICAEGRYLEGETREAAPRSSSAPSSAPSRAPISSPPRARRATPASTC